METLSTISTVIKGVFNIFAYPALLVCCQTHFTSGAKSIARAYKYGSAKQSSSVVKVVGKSEIASPTEAFPEGQMEPFNSL